ncbi:MAG: hypothetical protein ICV83_08190 [Cytophagales bacterium]|nr:hypothetical protein [Cytophagales bacterium]
MSCIACATNNRGGGGEFPCTCDNFVHPQPLRIDAGLQRLPRQIALFPQYRRAMLHALQTEKVTLIDKDNQLVELEPLSQWRATGKDDLGLMLLEMWAYLADALSFYDEVLANEAYLRTSTLRPHLRQLVALLGYRPRPAVGSVVYLAAFADGRLPVRLPAGTAFRSGAFGGNPPQVFELEDATQIHPLTNRWPVLAPHAGATTAADPRSLLVSPSVELKEGDRLLLVGKHPAHHQPVTVEAVEKYTGTDQQPYTRIGLARSTNLAAGTPLKSLRLLKPTQSAAVGEVGKNTLAFNTLLPEIRPGDFILLTSATEQRWFGVQTVAEANKQAMPVSTMTINGNRFDLPGVTIRVTHLTLDADINDPARIPATAPVWTNGTAGSLTVWYAMQPAALVVDEANLLLTPSDPLQLGGPVEPPMPRMSPGQFLLQDKNTLGARVAGQVDYDARRIRLDDGVTWQPALVNPVEAFGNVISASRGETVGHEILGSGDASVPNQTFTLKKKPLTYLLSPTAGNGNGVRSTLTVYVNHIRWTEVESFFGKNETDQVYIVRQNDAGESQVTFGDGVRGERVPTGTLNVAAAYRFGAEAAVPPAGAVNQVAKPVKGLQSVKNVLPAFGGEDAEAPEKMRTYAPRSALVLGRVVSLQDMEALAGSFPGVRAVKTEWRWSKELLTATAHLFYIGAAGIAEPLTRRLRNMADPSTVILVTQAQAVPLTIHLNVQPDPRYAQEVVTKQVRHALLDPQAGLLAPERIGIGQPLFRSKIFEAVLRTEGTAAVEGLSLDGRDFSAYGTSPGAGRYYDVEAGGLVINGLAT